MDVHLKMAKEPKPFVLPTTQLPFPGVFEIRHTQHDLHGRLITFEVSMTPNTSRVQLTKDSYGA